MKTSQLRFNKNATNCCKGVAVCLLVYFHLFGVQDDTTYTAVIPVLRNILAPYGNVCVVFFVLLTGYGFAAKHISAKEPYSRQIVPRLWGLYQGYWFVFATMFVIYPLLCSPNRSLSIIYGDTLFVFVERFLLDFLGLSHLVFQFAPYSLNQTWWYMSLAVLLFLFLPLLCALYREIGWWMLGLVTALSMALPDLRYLSISLRWHWACVWPGAMGLPQYAVKQPHRCAPRHISLFCLWGFWCGIVCDKIDFILFRRMLWPLM